MSTASQPGPVTRAARRKQAAAQRAAAPYMRALAAVGLLALILTIAARGALWLALIPLGGVLGIAADRFREHLGWHRKGGKAAMRKRRKYQGTATRGEIRRALSPAAVTRRAAVTCPGLDPSQAPVVIARAKGHDLAGSREDSYLLVAPPRAGKTGLVSCWVADAPGPVLATSTRTDLYAHTVLQRLRKGDAHVLNPDGDGGIPSTLAWSPVSGCDNPATAITRAGYLMDAAPHDKGGKDAYWDAKGAELLRLMLHAAAIAGASMYQVAAWVRHPESRDPASILAGQPAAPGWDHALAAILANPDQCGHVAASAASALSWMDDPAMARAACPPGDPFSPARFLAEGSGAVYLIGADRPHGSLAPYFAAFAADLFETAKRRASASPGGRLPRPLTLALDEAAITCPVPLHKWTAEAGGHGVTVMAAVQGLSQVTSRWGEHDGRTIIKNSTVKVFWGGDTDAADLEAISAVCGMQDTWDHVTGPDGSRTRTPRQERAIPPERIRMLGEGTVLVLHRNTRPVIAAVTPAWERRGYQRADLSQPFPWQQPQPAAIEAPRRAAMPVPPAPPQPVTAPAPVPALDGPENLTPVPDYAPEEAIPSWPRATIA